MPARDCQVVFSERKLGPTDTYHFLCTNPERGEDPAGHVGPGVTAEGVRLV